MKKREKLDEDFSLKFDKRTIFDKKMRQDLSTFVPFVVFVL